MLLNVFISHVAATIALRSYAPGTATALLFNLPLGGWFLYRSVSYGGIGKTISIRIFWPHYRISHCCLNSFAFLSGQTANLSIKRDELTL